MRQTASEILFPKGLGTVPLPVFPVSLLNAEDEKLHCAAGAMIEREILLLGHSHCEFQGWQLQTCVCNVWCLSVVCT